MKSAVIAGLFALACPLVAPLSAQQAKPLPPIDTDRPDLTDATTTVARGHIQFESGFTSQTSRDRLTSFSGPEFLVRIGVLSRAELRIGQNYRSIETDPGVHMNGLDDLQLGTKIRLFDQGKLPAISAEVFTTFTTGADGVGAPRTLPGAALLFQQTTDGPWSWGVELEAARGAVSGLSGFTSLSVQFQATSRVQLYGEWYQLQPDLGVNARQHYLDGGVLFLLSNDVQFDARVGVGLNHDADRSYLGFGLALRR
ncbi:MAG: transporter [Gemmatimonadota bacterium]